MKKQILLVVIILWMAYFSGFAIEMPENTDFVVAKDGSGHYTTIQEAVDAVTDNNSKRTIIFIKNGIYEETLNIKSSKRNVVLYGEDMMKTIITYKTEKTLDLATIQVYATDFMAYNLTIENTAGPAYGPAQALRQEADKSIYLNCRLLGNQDTYRTGKVRSYNKNCYFEGTVDFIFGDGSIVFENCDLYSKGGTALTAASTRDYSPFGYVFRDCRVVCQNGKSTHLGRPWKEYAAVAFINCELPKGIIAAGWHNWDKPEREATARYAEYNNFGPGADTSARVKWAKMLTAAEVEKYNTLNVLKATYASSPVTDNWNPYNDIKNAGIKGLMMEGDGYGMNEGGNGGTVVRVDNESDFKKYASSDTKYIIEVAGTIKLTSRADIGSNTTITGISAESGFSGAALNITNAKRNIVVKYLNITNPEGDGISVWNGHNVFINHISFFNCGDGCCDINRGSDSVTLSWCRFYYINQAQHRFTMIADGAMTWDANGQVDSYGNKLNLTLHHNWWYTGAHERMPSSTNTNAHLYNNYWNCIDNFYCSNARHLTEFYSQNNYYDNVSNPVYNGEADGKIFAGGNIYNRCTGDISKGTDSVFVPDYYYLPGDVEYVPYMVTSRAGNVWTNPEQFTVTSSALANGKVSPAGTATYNTGQLVTLEAQPNTGYIFEGWTGDWESKKTPLVFYVDKTYSVTAGFKLAPNVGIEDNEPANTFRIYPNPAERGVFYIKLPSGFSDTQVDIFSLDGKMIYSQKYENNGILHIEPNLKKGFYLVRLKGNGKFYSEKICVK